ncbi:MAG: hypothetical protein V1495_05250 [Pseudomonadota bacterium]
MKFRTWIVPVLLLATACVKSGPETQSGLVPASMRTYSKPFSTVWKAVTQTVQIDFMIPIEVIEKKRGYFASEMVKDYQPFQRSRYRLSGTVLYDGQSTVVKLYKQLEIEQADAWKTIPSDLSLESKILESVSKRLNREK